MNIINSIVIYLKRWYINIIILKTENDNNDIYCVLDTTVLKMNSHDVRQFMNKYECCGF